MIAIVVIDEKMGIEKNEQLLAHISGDLKYFKEKTIGKTILIQHLPVIHLVDVISG